MSNETTHPYAEQVRALAALLDAHPWLIEAETATEDGAVVGIRRYSSGCGVDVHLPGAAVRGIGDHGDDFYAKDGRRAFSTYKTEIDGLTVTTYAARRQADEVNP